MRLLWEGVRIALGAIWSHKLRSFLTLLANIVAVTSVITVWSILSGMDVYIREKVAGEGTGSFSITRVDPFKLLTSFDEFVRSLRNPDITLDDMEYLRERLTLASHVGAEVSRGSRVSRVGRFIDDVRIRGRTEEYALTRDWGLEDGRHMAPFEMERAAPVVVLGHDVADKLFPDTGAVGKRVRVGSRHFRVIGVIEKQGSLLGQSQDLFGFVPLTAYQKVFGGRQSLNITATARGLDDLDEAIEEARFFMRVRHKLRPGEEDDFGVMTSETLVSIWRGISRVLGTGILGIVAISLVVSGIIIMNVMLVSVNERTREIGLRKALGATRRALLWQFLVESVTFSMTGGILGIAVGFALAALVAALSPLPYEIAPWAIVFAVLVTLGVGLFFGLYPASRAASLDPIEALRHE